jgi:hypothetical protein
MWMVEVKRFRDMTLMDVVEFDGGSNKSDPQPKVHRRCFSFVRCATRNPCRRHNALEDLTRESS